jgi:ring-1,2-phenylacetyl-CoA epoxidase subunit PaaE
VDPQFWFVIGRIGGLGSWLFLGVAVLLGLAQSSRWFSGRKATKTLYSMHQQASLLSIVMVFGHIVGLLANTTLAFRVQDLFVPFLSTFEPRADVAWGIIAFYLLLAVQFSSKMRSHIPQKMWRGIHTTSFALFVFADIHSFTLGFDIPNPYVRWTAISFNYLIVSALLYRLVVLFRRKLGRGKAPAGNKPGGGGGRGGGLPAARPAPAPAATAMAMTAAPAGAQVDVRQPAGAPRLRVAPTPAQAAPVAAVANTRAARLRFYPLVISDVRWETNDATSVAFDVPAELADIFRFEPGQFLTLRTSLEGREVRRAYSISSGLADGELRVAVKRVDQGQMSNWVNAWLRVGATVDVMPPMGQFTAEVNPLRDRHVLGVAAGIGITPVISILKSILIGEPRSRCTLLYGNRDSASIVFRNEINDLQNQFSGRLRVLHVLSKEQVDTPLFRGRLNKGKLHALAAWGVDVRTVDDAYICAPDRMTTEVRQTLVELGMRPSSVHSEEYGVAEREEQQRQKLAVGGSAVSGLPQGSTPPAVTAGTTMASPTNFVGQPAGGAGAAMPAGGAQFGGAQFGGAASMATVTPMAGTGRRRRGGRGAPPAGSAGHDVTVICGGAQTALTVPEGQTILDAGLAAKVDMPYSCRAGFCGACRAAVVQGDVDSGTGGSLSDAEINAGFVLACQAKPNSGGAVISFDA